MFKAIISIIAVAAAAPLFAQLASALPVDRLAFANQLMRRSLHAEALKEYEAIRNEPGLPRDELKFRMGDAYRALSRNDEALREYGDLILEHPDSRFVNFARLNRAQILTGDAREKELLSLNHDGVPERIRATAFYRLGELNESRKNSKAAVDWYLKAARVPCTNEVVNLSRLKAATILSSSSEFSDRRMAQGIYLDLAASSNKNLSSEAVFFAGMMSYREGRYEEATTLFRRLLQIAPESPRAKESEIYAAWSYYLSARYGDALALATKLRAQGNEDAYYLVAAALRRLERRQDAIGAYTLALTKFPNGRHCDSEWFERLAVLAVCGDHAAVLEQLEKRPDPPQKLAPRAWSYGCEAAIAVTNLPRAIEFATLVAKNSEPPAVITAVHRLAWLYEKTGDWPKAALAYRTLAKKWPDNAIANQALYQAGVAEVRAGRPEQARADWTLLLSKYPDSPFACEALYSRAMEELRAKEYRAADHSLTELDKRFPDHKKNAESHYWRGVASVQIGDRTEAERHFKAALAAEPEVELEREIKLELASVLLKRGAERDAADIFSELIKTKVADRLAPNELAWLSEAMSAFAKGDEALAAAKIIEDRNIDANWNQIGAHLSGVAHEVLGESDAAAAAYARSLATGSRTSSGAKAALALGKLEMKLALFDEAKVHLTEAVERANSQDLIALRVRAYEALAANEESRGDTVSALGYHMLVGTLFDDDKVVPNALRHASAIMRKQGRIKEADDLLEECEKRYPGSVKKQ